MPPSGQRTFSVYNVNDVALTSGVEAVIATLGGVSTWSPDNVVRLQGWATISGAAGATAVALRIRRQSLTGALVGEAPAPAIAGAVVATVQVDAEDNPGDVAGLPYVLTAQMAGGNGTSNTAEIIAIIG